MKPILLAPALLLLTACILNPQTYPVLSPAGATYDAANRSIRTGDERSRMVSFCVDYNANRGMPADLAAKRCACTYDIARPQFTDAQWRRPSTNPNSLYMRRMNAAVQQCKRLYPTADARPNPPISARVSTAVPLSTSAPGGRSTNSAAASLFVFAPVPTITCAAATTPANGSNSSTAAVTPSTTPYLNAA